MTTKEYVLKYKLDKSDKFNHSLFVQDMANDFIALLELNKANDNIKGFDNAVRAIRMKFDAINNKTLGCIPESLWKFFFATVIVKLREQMCPRDMETRRRMQAEKKEQYEREKAWRAEEQNMYNSFFEFNFFAFLFAASRIQKPIECFVTLELPESADADEVKSAYKKLSFIHHPDKGGKQEDFIRITECKNKCLAWLNQ